MHRCSASGPASPRPLRILAVSDEVSRSLYDHYTPGKLKGYDVILSCGDLSKKYLEFLSSAANCPVLYVRGNHDDRLESDPPEGCECIDGKLAEFAGLRILGLGGSYRYRDGSNMYTERRMRLRILRLQWALHRKHGFDLLVTHAPIYDFDDLDSLSHRGFACFGTLLEKYRPAAMLHGHVHLNYGPNLPRISDYHGVPVVNAFDHVSLIYENGTLRPEKPSGEGRK